MFIATTTINLDIKCPPVTKINSKLVLDLHVKCKTIKLVAEDRRSFRKVYI